MDLDLTDFTSAFLDSEVIPVKLKTMGDGVIYLRHLCRADISRYKRLCREITVRSTVNVFAKPNEYTKIREADLDAAEDALIVYSLCKKDGSLLFENDKQYKEWSKSVNNKTVDEIIKAIKDNILFPPDNEDKFKKKDK